MYKASFKPDAIKDAVVASLLEFIMPTQSIQHESYLNTQDTGGSYAIQILT